MDIEDVAEWTIEHVPDAIGRDLTHWEREAIRAVLYAMDDCVPRPEPEGE